LGDNFHTPVWLFTNISLNDLVLIAVNGEGDHIFNVSDELIYYLSGFGWIEVWILEDLTTPGGIAFYEKSTGFLINGTFYYMGGIGNYTFDFVDTNVEFTYLPNDYEPTLTMGSVIPTTGNQTTLFSYTVNYSDADNLPPLYVNVSINDTYYLMSKQNPTDDNYIDGCIYQYSTYLQPGIYNYSFGCWDGAFYNSTLVQYNPVVSPTNEDSPSLSDGQVNPGVGFNGSTLFSYTVNYTDADNNAPLYVNVSIDSINYSLAKQNPMDNNHMDGCLYIFNTILNDTGLFTYYFTCSDGFFTDGDGPYDGPFVEVGLLNYTMVLNSSYSWIDTSATEDLGLSDDDYALRTLPFDFPFYNENYSQIYIGSNGIVSFYQGESWFPGMFPDTNYIRTIAIFADDLNPETSVGQVYVKSLTSPNRYVIIYDNITHYYDSPLAGSFEIILYEQGLIKLQFKEINDAGGAFCGINRGEGENYYNYYDNLNSSIVDYAIDFTYPSPPLYPSIIINSGEISTSSTLVTLTLSAVGADEMCFRNGTAGPWTSWESYGITKQIYLAGSTNNTEYTIQVRFRNSVGETAPVDDSILYLIVIPLNPSIVINNDDASTDSALVTLTLSAVGAEEMCFRNGTTGTWTSWESYGITKQIYLAGSTNNTEYTIQVKFRNSVGESSVASDSILYLITEEEEEPPPDVIMIIVIISIIGGTVVGVIIAYRIIKSRKGIEIAETEF